MVFWVILPILAGCAGSSPKDAPKGSLSRTLILLDEEGRQSGQLVPAPSGNATLPDEDDKVIGQLTFVGADAEKSAAASMSEEKPSEPETSEEETEENIPE